MVKRSTNIVILFLLCLVATNESILAQAKQYSFEHLSRKSGLIANSVQDIVQDDRGYIWVSSIFGLQRYDGNKFFTFHNGPGESYPLPSNNVRLLFIDSKHNLWVANNDNRIGIFNTRTYSYKAVSIPSIENNTLYQISNLLETKDGKIILYTKQKVFMYQQRSSAFVAYDNFVPVPQGWLKQCLVSDTIHNKFIIACDSGIAVFDPLTGNLNYKGHNKDKNLLVNKLDKHTNLQRMMIDAKGNIFLVSNANGISNFHHYNSNTGNIITYNLSNQLPGANQVVVNGVFVQKNGRVWIFGNLFLLEYDPGDEIFQLIENGCTDDNGIKFQNINKIIEDRENSLWVSTDNGVFFFNPQKHSWKPGVPPDPVITDFKMSNKSLRLDSLEKLSVITLPYDQNSISIEFNTLSFLNRENEVNYYKLEGIDKEWYRADKHNQAIYSSLPSGTYKFMVKLKTIQGISSPNITTLNIKVNHPMWKSWWFYGILVLLGGLSVYWLDRLRLSKILSMQQVRSEIGHNLHQQLNTALNNINLLSEMAKIKAEKDPEKSRDFINQISEKSRRMIDTMDDMLWIIAPENDNMEKVLLRMQQYAHELKHSNDLSVEITVDKRVKALTMDMHKRHEIFSFYKDMLTNVINSNATHANVRFNIVKSMLILHVQDDSTWYNKTISYNSQSMEQLRQKATDLHGKLDVLTDQAGTTMMLYFPIQ